MSAPVARTVRSFCTAYGVSERTAYNLMNAGKLAFRKMGKRTLILEESARAWFDSLPAGSRTPAPSPTPLRTPLAPLQEGARIIQHGYGNAKRHQ
jgi:hypothetical protein